MNDLCIHGPLLSTPGAEAVTATLTAIRVGVWHKPIDHAHYAREVHQWLADHMPAETFAELAKIVGAGRRAENPNRRGEA